MADAQRFGIDFGTTNSAIAFFDGRELHRPLLDPGSDNPLVLPSLLYIDRQQQATVGTAAAQQYLHTKPDGKRRGKSGASARSMSSRRASVTCNRCTCWWIRARMAACCNTSRPRCAIPVTTARKSSIASTRSMN